MLEISKNPGRSELRWRESFDREGYLGGGELD